MGQTARLRIIRDRLVAGHNSCDLRRHQCAAGNSYIYGILLIDAGFGRAMHTRMFGTPVSRADNHGEVSENDQVCPAVPEMHDWERREALGGDRYGYYGDFDI